jgi:ATP-dependent RNA helicase DeaD
MPDESTPKDPSAQDGADQPHKTVTHTLSEPTTLKEPGDTLPPTSLQALPEKLQRAVANGGWTSLMPVQARSMPYMLARRDLMVQSRTGSGKTGAFLLPILERTDLSRDACQALVLVPTRELAVQVAQEAELLAAKEGLRTALLYGGAAYGPQLDALKGGAHLVVGTPGRVLDHLLKGTLSLRHLQILVFDEADRMLSMGFYPDMRRVRSHLPDRPINAYMFSATFPPFVVRLAGEFLRKPEMLSLSQDHVHVAEVEHVYYSVPAMRKDRALVKIIEVENPVSAIIFCNTKANTHYVSEILQRFGYDADELSSDLGQGAREKVMARARAGKLRFLVATDVAARGIDIPDLSHVILYEPPEDQEAYIHRAGRTGRAGASGVAISLVAGMEEIEIRRIAKAYHIDIQERPVPTDEEVEAVVSQRLTAILEARLRGLDSVQAERMRRFVPLASSLGQSEDELAVIAMLLEETYRHTLHAVPAAEEREAKPPRTSAPRENKPQGQGRPRPRRR